MTTTTRQDDLTTPLTDYTNGLRALADWMDANPDVFPDGEVPWDGSSWSPISLGVWVSKARLAACARALPGTVEKVTGTSTVDIRTTFGTVHVQMYAGRSEVCERIVTGTEEVTVPAVEAQAERTEVRETVEWRCHPLLAEDPA